MTSRRHRVPAFIASAATLLSCATLTTTVSPASAEPTRCADIHILAVQGTSQSSSNAPTKQDQGMLSAIISPVLGAAAADKSLRIDRTYVPYRANFGDRGAASTDYRDSAGEGLNRLSQIANRIITQCPTTKIVPVGYSQGGHVVDAFASAVAAGEGAVTPESLAFVATYGSPTRAAGADLFPGSPGQSAPTALPEIGDLKPTKYADQLTVSRGQGIGPDTDQIDDFGPLNGRVADFCIPGDLACSAPRSASLLRLGSNIVEQSNLDFEHDPTGTAARLASAVADTAVRGSATVVNADITGTSLADLQFNPGMSISQRLSEVSAPRSLSDTLDSEQPGSSTAPNLGAPTNAAAGTPSGSGAPDQQRAPEGADNPLRAIARLGSIALNTVSTFATAMLTPENIGSMVSAGVAAISASSGNPVGAVAGAAGGSQLATAAMSAGLEAIPPATAVSGVKAIFQTLLNEVETNADLPQLVFDARTWNQVAYHGGYCNSPVSTTGASACEVTANWILTAARAYAKLREQNNQPPQAPKPGTTDPTAQYRTDDAGRAAPVGAIEVNTRPAGDKPDHIVLARNARPAPGEPVDREPANATADTIPVAVANTTLTEAQRLEVATNPRFVDPNQVQRLARYGTIALPGQQVSAA